PKVPTTAHRAWRLKLYQVVPCSFRSVTDEAEITITRPNRTRTATRPRIANVGEFRLPRRRRPAGWRRRDSARWSTPSGGRVVVVAMSVPPSRSGRLRCRWGQGADGAGEVVAPLAVGRVPVERGAARRQQHGVT